MRRFSAETEGVARAWEEALVEPQEDEFGNAGPPKRFTELGAMQLQRELRAVMDALAALLAEGSVRPHFSRLSNIVAVLSLERPSDILGYRGSVLRDESVFSIDDMAKVMRLRDDMVADAKGKGIDHVVGRLRALKLTEAEQEQGKGK